MTPTTHPPSPAPDDTRELLGLLADDTRTQLQRWISLSVFLRCPLFLPAKTRKEATGLVNHAIAILRAMLDCAKEAIRCFRKRRFDRCMRAMDRFDGLSRTLVTVDRLAARVILRAIFNGDLQ
jgi:hypothetical protein